MAQTLSSIAEQAKSKLNESLDLDPKADKQIMVDEILRELSPSDVSEILQLASLNPELLDQIAINAITNNVHNVIKVSLQEELVIIVENLDIKQRELIAIQESLDLKKKEIEDAQASIDAEKALLDDKASSIDELAQAVEEIAKP